MSALYEKLNALKYVILLAFYRETVLCEIQPFSAHLKCPKGCCVHKAVFTQERVLTQVQLTSGPELSCNAPMDCGLSQSGL